MGRQFTRLFFLALIILTSINVTAQNFKWVKGGGTAASDSWLTDHPEGAEYMCTDPNGNVYVLSHVGYYNVLADTLSYGAYGNDNNMLVTSYNCNGQMRWAKVITSSNGDCFLYGIAADSIGHIYVSGTMPNGNLRIGYDTTITASHYLVMGLVQLDTNGHFNWIRHIGTNIPSNYTTTFTSIGCMTIDNANNIHVLPYLLHPGAIISGDTCHIGTYDIQYNSSGTFLSIKKLQIDSTLVVYGAAIDKQSNKLYAYGYRNATFWTDYGGDSSFHSFISEFDTARNQIWIDTLGDETSGGDQVFTGIAPDGQGHLYLAATGDGYLVYQSDTIHTPVGAPGGYVSCIIKTDTSGHFKWASQCNGSSVNSCNGITLVPGNKVAVVGSFDVVIGSGSTILTNATSGSDPFLYVADTAGFKVSLQQLHGDGYVDYGNAIASDKVGNLYIGGCVEDSLPTGFTPEFHSTGGNTDFFVLKYGIDCDCISFPTANFTYAGNPTVNFTYTGTTSGIDSVRWYFGDGGSSIAYNPVHTYSAAGTYTVTVNIYSACGGDIHHATVYIPCVAPPVPTYTATGASAARNFTYTATTFGLDSVVWHYGDGSHSTGLIATHTYTATGTYTACALAYNTCGVDSVCHSVSVLCTAAPAAAFTDTGTYAIGFFYTGTTAGLDSVTWNYGDSHTGTGLITNHTFSAPGTYHVCVTSYTGCGSNTICHDVIIACTATPTASFTHSGTTPTNFTYSGTTAYLDSVVWNYGDGNTGHGLTSSHSYTVADTYHVCVTVYTACGTDSSCSDVIVPCLIPLIPSFTDTGITTVHFAYTGTTTNVDSVVWHFGDGTSDTTNWTATHTYTSSDTFHVCVYAYTACSVDSFCKDIIVIGLAVNDVANSLANVNVYPNPTTDELNITGIQESTTYHLINVTGSTVVRGVFQRGNNSVQLKEVVPGIYILEFIGLDGERKNFRIVKD